jgi:hypothetical protein
MPLPLESTGVLSQFPGGRDERTTKFHLFRKKYVIFDSFFSKEIKLFTRCGFMVYSTYGYSRTIADAEKGIPATTDRLA